MQIFKKAAAIMLLAAIMVTSLSSCMYTGIRGLGSDSGYITEDELENILANRLPNGDINLDGGDNNYITIEGGSSNIVAASKSLLSAVSVYAAFEKISYGFGGTSTQTSYSAGSGVIYKLDKNSGGAYVITNYHVVYNSEARTANKISDKISIYLYGMEGNEKYAIPATYVGGSMEYDLAVLKVDKSAILVSSNAMPATFANSNDVAVLDMAIAVGNPEGEGISATLGYVNVDSEYVKLSFDTTGSNVSVELRVMRIDTAVNSGNSGGGLFNEKGELIGIVNAKMLESENIGYAIPSNIVKNIADNILYYCDGKTAEVPYRCLVGITVGAENNYTVYDTETGKVHKREDVVIQSLTNDSIAKGYLNVGDTITSITIDGTSHEVARMYNVIDAMLTARVGSEVIFTVTRNGEKINVTVPITEQSLTACK